MMPWVKLDDQFADHPKIAAAGPLASWLHVCGLCYCARFLTDGFIPNGQIRKLADLDNTVELADKLVEVGIWEKVEGGYQIHDYLEYNPSREQVLATRQARAEAGAVGGQQAAASKAQAKAKQNAKQMPEQNESKSLPHTRSHTRSQSQSDTQSDTPESDGADAPSLPPETQQALAECLEAFGAKAYKTPEQRRQYIELYNKHGPDIFKKATCWGAGKGFRLGDIDKITTGAATMALNGSKPKREGNNGAIRRPAQVSSDADDAAYERFKQFD
jgi:hypothetical protein